MGEAMHQIGEVAARVGLSLRTVRYYEEISLVAPSGRTEGGFRLYTDADIDRLIMVKQMKPLEFSLEEMRDLLQARDELADPRTSSRHRGHLSDRLAMYAALAHERCKELRERLGAVEDLAATLQEEAAAALPARVRR